LEGERREEERREEDPRGEEGRGSKRTRREWKGEAQRDRRRQ
jgi:hypothetical protein